MRCTTSWQEKTDCVPVAGLGRSFLLGISVRGRTCWHWQVFMNPNLGLLRPRCFLNLSCQSLLDVVCRGPKELGGPEGQRPSWTKRRSALPVLELFLHEVLLSSRFG